MPADRQIMGGLVPLRTRCGAPAPTRPPRMSTPVSLHIGNLLVPAGNYTIYSRAQP